MSDFAFALKKKRAFLILLALGLLVSIFAYRAEIGTVVGTVRMKAGEHQARGYCSAKSSDFCLYCQLTDLPDLNLFFTAVKELGMQRDKLINPALPFVICVVLGLIVNPIANKIAPPKAPVKKPSAKKEVAPVNTEID